VSVEDIVARVEAKNAPIEGLSIAQVDAYVVFRAAAREVQGDVMRLKESQARFQAALAKLVEVTNAKPEVG
jgi:folate-dependent phosphoribosylglycinamide formyltransferase PurN